MQLANNDDVKIAFNEYLACSNKNERYAFHKWV